MNILKNKASDKIKNLAARINAFLNKRPAYTVICAAPLLNLAVEILSRRSLMSALRSIWNYPAFFVLNVMIVFITFLPSFFVKRRCFARVLISTVWLGLGITNFVLVGYRTTPLSATDLKALRSVWSIMGVYLNVWQIIAIISVFALAAVGLVFAFKKLPKSTRRIKTGVLASCFGVGIFLLTLFCGYRLDIVPQSVTNLAEAYKNYGFAWCFSLSIFDRGISKPDNYENGSISEILIHIDSPEKPAIGETGKPVNLVFVQLESFFDVSDMLGFEFSSKPTRTFNILKAGCPSGRLTVPVVGAGTVNTEFEVITGMNLDYFGTGEYPYTTVLQTETCESMAYNLAERGYKSHAIHNNTASFYDRDIVFSNLGFDTFTSIEYMKSPEYNALGWAKDSILTREITAAMNSTEGPDLVYTISVQPHGKYPREELEGYDYKLRSTGADDPELVCAWDYYINELRQTDMFIGELVRTLSDYNEPVVLVMYGDHLPSLEIEPDMVKSGSVYETEYVIWSNCDLKAYDRDLSAYQLSAYIMELLGYDNGILTKVHQGMMDGDAESYQNKLETLEYDMLYGDREIYGGRNPYKPSALKMGIENISVTGFERRGEVYFVYGENFTRWSRAYIDGEEQETLFVDENTLLLLEAQPESGSELIVAQVSDEEDIMSSTKSFIIE